MVEIPEWLNLFCQLFTGAMFTAGTAWVLWCCVCNLARCFSERLFEKQFGVPFPCSDGERTAREEHVTAVIVDADPDIGSFTGKERLLSAGPELVYARDVLRLYVLKHLVLLAGYGPKFLDQADSYTRSQRPLPWYFAPPR